MQKQAIFLMFILIVGTIPLSFADYMGGGTNEAEEAKVFKDIKITADKKEYILNQPITFTLTSNTFYKDRIVEITIFNPSGSMFSKNGYVVESENQSFKVSDKLLYYVESGTYKVLAAYDDAQTETSFNLTIPQQEAKTPQIALKDSPAVFEGVNPNEISPQKEIANLKLENQKLKDDLASMNTKLDSLNAVLLEQTKVLIDLAKSINEMKNTLATIFHFDIFA